MDPRVGKSIDGLMENSMSLTRQQYRHCQTRIVDIQALDLPDSATDEEFQHIYRQYVNTKEVNAVFLRDAVESIRYGTAPPVAFPTETVYGLGADATNESAVAGIFAAKGRPNDNPLIVHTASASHLESLIGQKIPEVYRTLVEKFWPGPLTVLIPIAEQFKFAKNVHPGQPTIGFRVPQSKYARFFIAATDRPIAGPSANSSGKPSPVTAQHVLDDLNGKINFILDGGSCDIGVESTVVDGLHDPPLILRPGGISQQALIAHGIECDNEWKNTAIGYKRHETYTNTSKHYVMDINGAPRAPGMKYRHYAPEGKLILFSESAVHNGSVLERMRQLMTSHSITPLRIGIISCKWSTFAGFTTSPLTMCSKDKTILDTSIYRARVTTGMYTAGATNYEMVDVCVGVDINDLAHDLFGILRFFDDLKCDFIFAEAIKSEDLNGNQDFIDAVADRIDKAAAERVD